MKQTYTSLIKLLVYILAIFSCLNGYAQNITGMWQGYITAENTPLNSGYLLNIEKQNSEYFSGRAYIYRDGIFDGHLDFIGTAKDSVVKLTELRVLRYRTPPTWFVCVKFCNLDFMHRNSFDNLTGDWKGSIYDGTICSPGEVILRRYAPSNPDGIEPVPASIMLEVKKNEGQPMRFLNTELDKPVIIPVQNRVVQFEHRDSSEKPGAAGAQRRQARTCSARPYRTARSGGDGPARGTRDTPWKSCKFKVLSR